MKAKYLSKTHDKNKSSIFDVFLNKIQANVFSLFFFFFLPLLTFAKSDGPQNLLSSICHCN